jgi:hypothetical protein
MTSNLTFLRYFFSIERAAEQAFDFLASLSASIGLYKRELRMKYSIGRGNFWWRNSLNPKIFISMNYKNQYNEFKI